MSGTTTKNSTTRKATTKTDAEIALGQNSAAAAVAVNGKPGDVPADENSTAGRDARLAKSFGKYLRGIGSARKTLSAATSGVRDGIVALGFARVNFGAAVLPVYVGLTDEKGDYRWKSSSALDHIVATYLSGETDERGKPYNGATVHAWIVAAEQESLLPTEQRGKFGSDAHRTLARVRKAKGDRAMLTFANGQHRKGEYSVGSVRKAYADKYPADPPIEETPASVAQKIQTEEIESAQIMREQIKSLGLDPKTVKGLLLAAAGIGQRYPDADPEALSIALSWLSTEPKPKATRTRKAR